MWFLVKRSFIFVLLLALAAGNSFAELTISEPAIPELTKRVTDLTNTLNPSQQATLEDKLEAFEKLKGSQIAVLIVETTQPYAIENYSIRVVDKWQLGRKNIDDGVLLLIAKHDRKIRIDVGYGLEGALPDVTAKRIIDEFITPAFKQGDFFNGINSGLDKIISVVDGESLPSPTSIGKTSNLLDLFPFLIFIYILSNFLGQSISRLFGALMGSGLAGFATFFLTQSFFSSSIVGGIMFLILLMVGPGGGMGGGSSRHYRNGSSSSYGGYSGGGYSSGGGGFSGGGGSFGGGGASGGW